MEGVISLASARIAGHLNAKREQLQKLTQNQSRYFSQESPQTEYKSEI